jgi:hypothetical protein
VSSTIGRRGNVLGPQEVLEGLSDDLANVPCWGRVPDVQWRSLYTAIGAGCTRELQFDAAHGFRKVVFLWRTSQERRAIWDYLTRPGG